MFNRLWLFSCALLVSLFCFSSVTTAQAAPTPLGGVVLDSAGQPVSAVPLELQALKTDAQGHRSWHVIAETATDKTGRFAFAGLDHKPLDGEAYRVDLAATSRHTHSEFMIVDDVVAHVRSADLNAGGRINGKVTGDNNQVATDVAVSLYRVVRMNEFIVDQLVRRTLTDESGRYSFRDLPAGEYKLGFADTLDPVRYVAEYHADALDSWPATVIPLGDGTAVIDAQLARAAALAGTVRGPAGEPVGEIYVTAYRYGFFGMMGMDYIPWPIRAMTLADGTYSIQGLPAGNYRIGYVDTAWPNRFAQRFYTNGNTVEEGVDVALAGGQWRSGVDMQMVLAGQVRGIVTDGAGEGVEGIEVRVYQLDQHGQLVWDSSASGYTASDGTYTLSGLAAGTYMFKFADTQWPNRYQSEFYPDALTPEAATSVVVAEGVLVSAIDAQLARWGAIQGQVTTADGASLANGAVTLYQQAEDGQWYFSQEEYTDETGTYLFGGLSAGRYRVGFTYGEVLPPVIYYNQATTLADATVLTVAAGATVSAINGQLPTPGALRGRVTDEAGQPLAAIAVTALYSTTFNGYAEWSVVATAITDNDGSYHVTNLPTGNYLVHFGDSEWPNRYSKVYYNGAFTSADAQLVAVTNGSTTSAINAQLVDAQLGLISGQLRDQTGAPLPFIRVVAQQKVGNSAGNELWLDVIRDVTNTTGHYTLRGLDVGTYRLFFYDSQWPQRYAAEYYNNVTDPEAAADLLITAGAQLTEINADLALATGSQITGRVTDALGAGMGGIEIMLLRAGIDAAGNLNWTSSDHAYSLPDGSYTIPILPAGRYRVRFFDYTGHYRASFYANATDLDSATDLFLDGAAPVSNIDAQLVPLSNDTPVAHNDSGAVTTQERVQISGFNVLANDLAANGAPLTAHLVTNAKHGTVDLHVDGSFVYTAGAQPVAVDFFTYRATDGVHTSNVATVFIVVDEQAARVFTALLPLVRNR